MYTNSKVAKAIRLAMIMGAASATAMTANVSAQEAGAEEEVERIQVTGSRIMRTDMEGANPVQVISREDIKISGITNVGDLLQEIPSVSGAATNTAVNNGGTGAINISLRGLGSQYTLVLLNGRRMPASGSGADDAVDLSSIPTAVIKRIEILKDGASAIYGSDAIAGVVNIVTHDDFEGAEFNATVDQSTHGADGYTRTLDFTVGTSSDKGSATVSAYYTEQGEQWSGDREWSMFELDLDSETGELNKGGSSAPPWGRYNGIDGANGCGSFTHGAGSGPGQSDPTDFTNPTGYECWDWDVDTYNYAPANYHLTPSERYGIFAQADYELNDNVRFFTEISYTHRASDTLLAPLPLAPLAFFGQNAPYSADNYYNQQFGPKDANGNTVEIADWRRRVVETGGRKTQFRLNNSRAVMGFDGEINDALSYEVYYLYGINEASLLRQGGVNFEKVVQAVGPSFMDDNGNVVCGTPDAPIAGCVSLNTFGIPGTETEITKEMLDFISFEAHDVGGNEQQLISASIFGDAFEMPAGTAGFAFGLEHRTEKGWDYPDALIALGITSGSSRTATEGEYTVDEAYLEMTFPIFESFDIDAAIRYSDYDTFGDTTNHKLGFKFRPLEGLMFRGTMSTAFRAPSTSDLFAGNSDNSPEVADPCAENPTQFCLADGVPAGGFEPIGDQLSSTRGGNQDLQPEESDTITLGVVYNPSFAEGLSLTLDYWDIELTNAISTVGEQIILNNCAFRGVDCDKITRFTSGPLAGNSIDIDDRNVNVGGVDSSGFDFNIRYTTDISFGQLKINLDTTYYDEYAKTLADGTIQYHEGRYFENADGNFPTWKTNLDVGLVTDDWSANWSMRYIDSVEEQFDRVDVGDTVFEGFRTQVDPTDATKLLVLRDVDSQIIHDIRFTYYMDELSVSFGVDNVFDEEPPYAATGFNDNTDPRTYNTVGRHISLALGLKF
ncbi:TonB-dependent receptor plug domain-containing protein [Flocculibacter collagenilyticus]|uniref:TonB-dependent receptor plug domain-containing protein n=1 Tax=Flocculibacter collagenilyticus TaxID=2744479 RepID=UPI0018F7CDF6|nr:TonB-dependent receptor [Flocculibacter collagenilyticus]